MNTTAVDLPVDLNSEDDTGLPWGFLDESQNPSKITQGAWIIAGSSRTQAVAQPRARRPFWSARTCVTGHKPKASNKSLVKAAKLAATVVSDGISDAARVGRKFLASCRWRGVAAGATQVHVARGDRPDVRTYPASAPTSWLTSRPVPQHLDAPRGQSRHSHTGGALGRRHQYQTPTREPNDCAANAIHLKRVSGHDH
jgi:hypothetical protein